jgi:hypothetical protein
MTIGGKEKEVKSKTLRSTIAAGRGIIAQFAGRF